MQTWHFKVSIFKFLKGIGGGGVLSCFVFANNLKAPCKRDCLKGLLNLSQRENVFRSQGVGILILCPFDQRKFADHFTSHVTIINVSLYNYLYFVYSETPGWQSFLFCICILFLHARPQAASFLIRSSHLVSSIF